MASVSACTTLTIRRRISIAEYQGHEAFVSIETGAILQGHLPAKATRIIQEWAVEHRAELLENWTKARNLEPLHRIPRADND